MIALEELDADDWRCWRELRLQALDEAPYAYLHAIALYRRHGFAFAKASPEGAPGERTMERREPPG